MGVMPTNSLPYNSHTKLYVLECVCAGKDFVDMWLVSHECAGETSHAIDQKIEYCPIEWLRLVDSLKL